MTMDDDGKE